MSKADPVWEQTYDYVWAVPRKWYVRMNNRDDSPEGPFTFVNGALRARRQSRQNETHTAELYEVLDSGAHRVHRVYINGKLKFQGRVAQDRSDRGRV